LCVFETIALREVAQFLRFFFQPIELYLELAYLLIQSCLSLLRVLRVGIPLFGEDLMHVLLKLLLPVAHQHRVHLVLRRDGVDRFYSPERFQGHLGLELRAEFPSFFGHLGDRVSGFIILIPVVQFLGSSSYCVNRKRVQRLMGMMGLEAIYRKPNLSKKHASNPVFPYLLRGLDVNHPNQVWAMDITYIPIKGGFIYLCAVIDWYSRAVLAWELSNTLDASFCVQAVERAIEKYGTPEIFNTDQGCQFTSSEFTQPLLARGIKISMDGKGRALDNVFVERLWRTVKWDEVYLKSYVSQVDAFKNLDVFFRFYNEDRPHSAFGETTTLTPMDVYRGAQVAKQSA